MNLLHKFTKIVKFRIYFSSDDQPIFCVSSKNDENEKVKNMGRPTKKTNSKLIQYGEFSANYLHNQPSFY